MALVSISEAARITGKSRRTIQRHISTGKISKSHDDTGNSVIDTSEILRVYGALEPDILSDDKSSKLTQHDTINNTHKIELLEQEVRHLKELLAEKEQRNQDLKQSLLLLEHKVINEPTKEQKKQGFFSWFKKR